MGLFNVEGGKYTKLKNAYVVENGKYVKLSKAYVVEGGKYVKVWSANNFKLVASSTEYPTLFSDDGLQWSNSESSTLYRLTNIINVNGVLYGLTETYYTGNQYYWYLYKSIDGGLTWTQIVANVGYGGNYILRYVNGKMFVIGTYTNSGNLNTIWYSSNLGDTWTGSKYTLSSTTPSGSTLALNVNSKPLDFTYGTVGSETYYYLLISNYSGNNSFIYKFSTHTFISGSFVGGSSYNSIGMWDKGALSVKNGTLYIIGNNTSATYTNTTCYRISNLSNGITQVKSIGNNYLGVVASNSNCMIFTCGSSSYKLEGTTVTTGGSIGSQTYSNAGTFAASFVNGTRVFAYKSYSSKGYVMYSDDYGATWTIIEASNLTSSCTSMCSITDSYK